MKFEDYMALREDFDTPDNNRSFGETTPYSGNSSSAVEDDKMNKFDAQAAEQNSKSSNMQKIASDVNEAADYIRYVYNECFGMDKIDRPSSYGLDAAVQAINQFAGAGDGQNFSVPSIDKSFGYKKDGNVIDIEDLKEMCNAVLEATKDDVSAAELCGDDEEDFLTVEKNGIDDNTILITPEEKDQFAKSTDIKFDGIFDNSDDWD